MPCLILVSNKPLGIFCFRYSEMNVIRLKKKNICIIVTGAVILYMTINNYLLSDDSLNGRERKVNQEFVVCSKKLKWHIRKPGTVPASQFGKNIGNASSALKFLSSFNIMHPWYITYN